MRVLEVVRHSFGAKGEFVEYPVTSVNRDWNGVRVYKHEDRQDGLTLHGVLLHRSDGFSVYSCGGLLACLKDTEEKTTCISVVPLSRHPRTRKACR